MTILLSVAVWENPQEEHCPMAKSLGKHTMCEIPPKVLQEDLEAFAGLVSKPRYVCRKCLRVARSKKNLCKPTKLKEA